MSDPPKGHTFEYDVVVLHSDDEWPKAEKFCEDVRRIKLNDGRSPNIVTMEAFSHPGKTLIRCLDDAMLAARFIFCSEEYHTQGVLGTFSGDVAMLCKIPDKFVKLIIGRNRSSEQQPTLASMRSFTGLHLDEEWGLMEKSREKLRSQLFKGQATQYQKKESMPALPDVERFEVMNPSISSTVDSDDTTEVKRIAMAAGYPEGLADGGFGGAPHPAASDLNHPLNDLIEDTELETEEDEAVDNTLGQQYRSVDNQTTQPDPNSGTAAARDQQPAICRVEPSMQQAAANGNAGARSMSHAAVTESGRGSPDGATQSSFNTYDAQTLAAESNLSDENRELLKGYL